MSLNHHIHVCRSSVSSSSSKLLPTFLQLIRSVMMGKERLSTADQKASVEVMWFRLMYGAAHMTPSASPRWLSATFPLLLLWTEIRPNSREKEEFVQFLLEDFQEKLWGSFRFPAPDCRALQRSPFPDPSLSNFIQALNILRITPNQTPPSLLINFYLSSGLFRDCCATLMVSSIF